VVKKCSGKMGGTCANSSTFTSALYNHETFKLNVYFANPIIDPSEKEYLDYSLEDTIYFEFTDMLGVRSHIFFSEY
jgi:predicted adenine nucleotide alpha hydrolase (AANH) superfamily ATPase